MIQETGPRQNFIKRVGKTLTGGGFALDKRSVAPYEAILRVMDRSADGIHSAADIFTEGDSPKEYRKARLIVYTIGSVGCATGVAIGLSKIGESLSKSLTIGAVDGVACILISKGLEFVFSKTSNKSSNKQT